MFCIKCGAQIRDDAVFCPKCGAKVAGVSADNANDNGNISEELPVAKTGNIINAKREGGIKTPFVIIAEILAVVAIGVFIPNVAFDHLGYYGYYVLGYSILLLLAVALLKKTPVLSFVVLILGTFRGFFSMILASIMYRIPFSPAQMIQQNAIYTGMSGFGILISIIIVVLFAIGIFSKGLGGKICIIISAVFFIIIAVINGSVIFANRAFARFFTGPMPNLSYAMFYLCYAVIAIGIFVRNLQYRNIRQ